MLFSQISLFTAWYLRHTILHYWRTPEKKSSNKINLLTPNVNYSGHTGPLTPKVAFYIFIQQI